jgi:microcystin-dependent protein
MDPIIGQIQQFGFDFAPRGWQTCEGQSLPINQYSALFSLLGTTYGGDGVNTFSLPDLRGRTVIHQGQGPGLANYAMGQKGGQENVTISMASMPAHTHNVAIGVNTANGEEAIPTGVVAASANSFSEDATAGAFLGGVNAAIVGQGTLVPVRDPYLVVTHCIALQGIFPSRN